MRRRGRFRLCLSRPARTPAFYVRDGELFDAASIVASDTGASAEARVASLLVLPHALLPSDLMPDYDEVVKAAAQPLYDAAVDSSDGFRVERVSAPLMAVLVNDMPSRRVDAPLPPDAARRLRAIVEAIPDDASVPTLLRVMRRWMATTSAQWLDPGAPGR